MIAKLTLINFMAHARSEFELAPGLNVLTGPNNTGKSAVVEALRCLAENPIPRHVIRHGAAEARVEVAFADGTALTWVRRPRYALYELTRPGAAEPEVFAKFGRTPPEEILSLLRLDLVPLESGETVDVHIGNQREPVFLLGQPGSVVAGFFAASTEAAHLIAMQNRLTDRTRKAKIEKGRLEARLAAIAAELDKLAPLPDLEMRLAVADGLEDALGGLSRDIPALEKLLAARQALHQRGQALARARQALSALASPPVPAATAPLADLLSRRLGLARAVSLTSGRQSALETLAAPPALADTPALASRLAALAEAGRLLDRKRAKTSALAHLAAPPAPADTQALAELGRRLDQARSVAQDLARKTRALAGLAPPPQPADTQPLGRLLETLAARREAVAAKKRELAAKGQALAALKDRIAARLAELGACPLCGAKLCAHTFLTGDAPVDSADAAQGQAS